MIPVKMKQFVIFIALITFIFMAEFISPAFAKNVFPIKIGGQEKIYMDTNDVEGIDDGDKYFTLKRVTLEDAGDDTGKNAIILERQGADYQSIYVLDGLGEDGGLEIHEPQTDIAYQDDSGNKVIVKNKWAHVGEKGAPSDYEGFIHSARFGMSDSNKPYNGFNNMSWQVERGSKLEENINQSGVTIEYNNDDYANTLSYDTGGPAGKLLMDINSDSTEMRQDRGVMEQVFGSYGSKLVPVHIPLDQDGNVVATDSEDDGFFMKFSMKPVRTDDAQPIRLPSGGANPCELNCDIDGDGKAGLSEAIYILQIISGLRGNK